MLGYNREEQLNVEFTPWGQFPKASPAFYHFFLCTASELISSRKGKVLIRQK